MGTHRQQENAIVGLLVSTALIRFNPLIAAKPDRADEMLVKLRAVIVDVRNGNGCVNPAHLQHITS